MDMERPNSNVQTTEQYLGCKQPFRSVLQRPAVGAWRRAGDASENAGHVMVIGEAARLGNLSQRSTEIGHQGLRSLQSPVK
jgi:hypothetical protein